MQGSPRTHHSSLLTPLYFLHVPKAGGNSWRATLLNLIPGLAPCAPAVCSGLAEPSTRFCLHNHTGHAPYTESDTAWRCAHRHALRMVMLRQPLSRIRSAYSHAAKKKSKTEPNGRRVGCCGMPRDAVAAIQSSGLSLEGYCRYPGSANVIAKQLSGRKPSSTRTPNTELALRTLNAFEFVGITEYYHESVALLRHTLGLVGETGTNAVAHAPTAWATLADGVTVHTNVHNSTSQKGCNDASAEARNAIDMRLYREGVRLFASRFCAVWPQHRVICDRPLQREIG